MRYLLVCLLLASFTLLAAEEPTPAAEPEVNESTATNSAADADDSVTNDPDVAAADTKPTDTLGGSGLKNRQLGDIFEQFVPTETISADNAVPFPVDI